LALLISQVSILILTVPSRPFGLSQILSIYGIDITYGADKSLAFPIFLFAVQPKEFFLDGLKKSEQRSHNYVALRGGYVE
jgi:hypothetical protein